MNMNQDKLSAVASALSTSPISGTSSRPEEHALTHKEEVKVERKRTGAEKGNEVEEILDGAEEGKDDPKIEKESKSVSKSSLLPPLDGPKEIIKERSQGLEARPKVIWTVEETRKLMTLYKAHGSRWSLISKSFDHKTENDVKNKFYTTLKRVATQAQIEDPAKYSAESTKRKNNLVQFVDVAMMHADKLSSKRGRKRNSEKLKARREGLFFPRASPSPSPTSTTQPQYPMTGNLSATSAQAAFQTGPIIELNAMQRVLFPFPLYSFQPTNVLPNCYYGNSIYQGSVPINYAYQM